MLRFSTASLTLCGFLALAGCDADPQPRAHFDQVTRQQWEQQLQAARVQGGGDRGAEVKALEQALEDKDLEIARLQAEVNGLRDKLATFTDKDGSPAGGEICEIDAQGHVWIDVGSADGVAERQVYSILAADGSGADPQKGQLLVTRVMGEHLSQAKALAIKTVDKVGIELPLAVGDKLVKLAPAGATTTTRFAPSKSPVQVGKVLKYEADLEMVTISLGSDQGIVKGQKLYVYRTAPAKFLCEVKVLVAMPGRCSAQHVEGLNAPPVSLVVGDRVATAMPLGLERPSGIVGEPLEKRGPVDRPSPLKRAPLR